MCFSRFIILQRCGYAIFICSKSCKLLFNHSLPKKKGYIRVYVMKHTKSPC
nr:MAG TPA: hypothetical protein [Caudoviricetes sp.]